MSKDKKKQPIPEPVVKEEPKKFDIREFLSTASGLNVEILRQHGEDPRNPVNSERCGKGVVKACYNVDGDKPELVIIDETKSNADSGFILEISQCESVVHDSHVVILDTISKYIYNFQTK